MGAKASRQDPALGGVGSLDPERFLVVPGGLRGAVEK